MFKILSKIWKLFNAKFKWHILWLFHDKFIIGTSAVILNNEKQVLLLQHRFWKKDSWGLPSGYAEKREKLEDAIQREIFEETGLKVEINNFLKLNSGFKLRIEATFLGTCTDASNIKINTDEIISANFFSTVDLPIGLLETHRKLIESALIK